MYVTTFYSFKGGVGRTMALANAAYELSRRGYRVLIVDFDLEAPGLDTFDRTAAGANRAGGLVDFVIDYLQGEAVPDVREYVYEAPGLQGGENPVLIMPAGRVSDNYAARLATIDWAELYREQDGYLMFEDLRAQWEKRLKVDYVLIDSRTGHTDVGGICTRHLPDAVVVLFFPNEQNLRGLCKVVLDIREEPKLSGRRAIDLLFVASNVPDMDDEEDILKRRLAAFRNQLRIDRLITIKHYSSLALLEQPVFTRDRVKTGLAKQYRLLVRRIQESNLADRAGVLSLLREPVRDIESYPRFEHFLNRLTAIESAHASDGEVLFALGEVRSRLGQVSESLALYEQAMELGFSDPVVYLQAAEAYQRLGDPESSVRLASRVVANSASGFELLLRTVELLRIVRPNELRKLSGSAAVSALSVDDKVEFAAMLDRSRNEMLVATDLLSPLLARASGSESWYAEAAFALGLAAMGSGDAERALGLFKAIFDSKPESAALFNQATARWVIEGRPDSRQFQEFLNRYPWETQELDDANVAQCYALAEWICGNEARAAERLSDARDAILLQSTPEFTCWRYLRVSPEEFRLDLDEIARLFAGEAISPRFLANVQADLPLPV